MDPKKLVKAFLFPHRSLLFILLPISVTFLVYSMVVLGTEMVPAYISYALSAYTLTIWSVRIPDIIRSVRYFKNENKYVRIWLDNPEIRVKVTLYTSLVFNVIYALFNIWLGLYHSTFWFASIGIYYFCLTLMRLFLLLYTRKHGARANIKLELLHYRNCGIVFLVMNIALALMVFFMVYWGRTFHHHMITAIAMAAYTFTSFTIAIVSMVRFRKYESPVFSASKAISLASALVSMLTLTSTMLSTFGDGTMELLTRRILLGMTGGAVSLTVTAMAIYMIVQGTRKLRQLKNEVKNEE